MDKNFQSAIWEPRIRTQWDSEKKFHANIHSDKKPFTIVLPPPNANGSLHVGHAMYVYQDVMCRYARSQGYEVLWVPGSDHAGFETQYVFEKHLAKQNKSRFDFSRDTLYQEISTFVESHRGTMEKQMRAMGFSLDWDRACYTLDPQIIKLVQQTFKKLFDDGLVYRADRLVQYCCKDGTSFSDLEIVNEEIEGVLYSITYGPLVVATTRPETLLGDVAVMVHPNDTRYTSYIGTTVLLPIVNKEIPVIADSAVDPAFGTGVVKVTPHHDYNDWEVSKRHNLKGSTIIGFDGRICNTNTIYDGLKVRIAREKIITDLQAGGFLHSQQPHQMVLKKCYKCGSVLEPLPKAQWYIKVAPLVAEAQKLIDQKKVQVHPHRFTPIMSDILKNFIDWNISRQIVWGIRIPAFYHIHTGEWHVELDTQKQQELVATGLWKQDEDTFDTWFSSGQWPYVTLQSQGLLDKFYPTTVMETGYDIARAWVARMLMLGTYITTQTPFQHIFFHGMVRDGKGQKMSKSKGNVINPLTLTEKYGTDALRAALVFETTAGADVNLAEEKVRGMRNFVNKLWNIARFLILTQQSQSSTNSTHSVEARMLTQEMQDAYMQLEKNYHHAMQHFEIPHALNILYEFVWRTYAEGYLERSKPYIRAGDTTTTQALRNVYMSCLTLLEPFVPFIVAAIRTHMV